jgi:tripartite-type tricarboxylate transporter receptor subunit TctC
MNIRLPRRALGAAALAMPMVARAQGRRTLRLLVPFPPGGAVDSLARILGERLQPVLDQTVVVDNRSGAGGLIGADAVAKGPPDGSLLGIIGAATFCAAPVLQASMPFDPIRDLKPVTQITDSAVIIVVNAARAAERGWTSLPALLAWGRANPGRLQLAHSGPTTVSHLTLAAIMKRAGIEATLVPYRGGAQAATDVLAGTIDGSADLPSALVPHIEAGRLRALAVSSATRLALLPDIPGMAEFPGSVVADMDVRTWNMMTLPAGTPAAEVLRLHAALLRVAAMPDFRAALRPLAYDPVTSASPEAAAQLIADETPRWRQLVEMSGAKLE